MHINITHVSFAPKTGCTTRKVALFITGQDRQTQILVALFSSAKLTWPIPCVSRKSLFQVLKVPITQENVGTLA